MKKAFALVMAIAMVASMAAVSFAATGIDVQKQGNAGFVEINPTSFYLDDEDAFVPNDGSQIAYGKTVYVGLKTANWEDITDSESVAGMKVSAKWTEGAEYIKGVEIVKENKIYVIAITTTGSELTAKDVSGTISLGGKTVVETVDPATNKVEKERESVDVDFDVDFTLAYPKVVVAADAEELTVSGKKVYDFEENEIDVDEFEFNFGTDLTAVVDVKNVNKVLYSFNEDENDELIDAYVDADLLFYNCSVAFRRTADVTLAAEEGSYLYEVVDGELVAVDAEYDEWEEAFTFKTKKLGNYVVSDVELEVAEEVVAANPSTGAAA